MHIVGADTLSVFNESLLLVEARYWLSSRDSHQLQCQQRSELHDSCNARPGYLGPLIERHRDRRHI